MVLKEVEAVASKAQISIGETMGLFPDLIQAVRVAGLRPGRENALIDSVKQVQQQCEQTFASVTRAYAATLQQRQEEHTLERETQRGS